MKAKDLIEGRVYIGRSPAQPPRLLIRLDGQAIWRRADVADSRERVCQRYTFAEWAASEHAHPTPAAKEPTP